MDGVRSALLDDLKHSLRIEIGLGGGLAAEGKRLIGQPNMKRISIELGVDGGRSDAELFASTNHSHGNFAAIRDQDIGEHGLLRSSNGMGGASWHGVNLATDSHL